MRVIGCDFDSYLSQWGGSCPTQSFEHQSLEERWKNSVDLFFLKAFCQRLKHLFSQSETEIKITTSSRSEDMLKKLQAAGVGQRPTVFVGHSMGGLIIKKMLVNAQNSDDEERKKFAENTKGIVFYSTPHKGSEIANLNMITKYFFSPSVEVQELNTDYPLLLELNNYFKGFVEKFKTKVNSSDNALKGSFTMNIRKLKKTTIKRRIFAGYQLRGDLTDAAHGGEHDLRAAGELEPWCWRLLHRPLQPHGHLQTQQQEEHTV